MTGPNAVEIAWIAGGGSRMDPATKGPHTTRLRRRLDRTKNRQAYFRAPQYPIKQLHRGEQPSSSRFCASYLIGREQNTVEAKNRWRREVILAPPIFLWATC